LDLRTIFTEINHTYFEGTLELPSLVWNSRIRTAAGRFKPGSRKVHLFQWLNARPVIEIAAYLLEEKDSENLIWDTMAHEMIHYWLWSRRQPYGHTPEFMRKMRAMGVSRYNSVPRRRPPKYIYECPHCKKQVPARRILKGYACRACCKALNHGKYDPRFKLSIVSETLPEPTLERAPEDGCVL